MMVRCVVGDSSGGGDMGGGVSLLDTIRGGMVRYRRRRTPRHRDVDGGGTICCFGVKNLLCEREMTESYCVNER